LSFSSPRRTPFVARIDHGFRRDPLRSGLLVDHPPRLLGSEGFELDGFVTAEGGPLAGRRTHGDAGGQLHLLRLALGHLGRLLDVEAAVLRRRRDHRQPLAHRIEQRPALERLLEVGEGPVLGGRVGGRVSAPVHARHEHERDAQPLEAFGDVEAHQIGEQHVEYDQIGLFLARQLQGCPAPLRRVHRISSLLERRREEREQFGIVVDDEDAGSRHDRTL
jgi:hypothetical protein